MSEEALQLIAENKKTKAPELDLSDCGLIYLPEDLSACTWLTNLDCSDNQISDLSPISGLKNLQSLTCDNNQIADLVPVSGLMNLKMLSFFNNQIEDLLPVSQLLDLEILFCVDNLISDLWPVSNLLNLQSLYYSNNQISDLSPISGLRNLQVLYCGNTKISDLSPISRLISLQELDCSSNEISDLSGLSGLGNLQTLDCSSNQISDLSGLSGLDNLQELDCTYNQISDLSGLSGLGNLQTLSCYNNQISDLSPLSGLGNLQTLDCSYNKISDLSPLSGLGNLQTLDCSYNKISDLSPLSGLDNLQMLSCSYNQISDLLPLSGLGNLQMLSCYNNQISDLSPLSGLGNLQTLSCYNNQISDLLPLSGLGNLQTLSCYNNQISDLSPLSGLDNLQTLSCYNNQISDLSPLLPFIRNQARIFWEEFDGRDGIFIKDCPLVTPPVEFVQAGNEAIIEYFNQLGDDRTPLNEIKVIFLGDGAAGKTSLVKRIRNEAFDRNENQTHGIRINKTEFVVENDRIQAHIWDFGGQDVMHATHQFFLSHRCVYVLVLNSRTDDKAEYWLKHAASFGGNSPVLVVLNKMDENPGYDVNRKQLSEKYQQIAGFFKVSCLNNDGVDDFKKALTLQVAKSDTRRTPFPKAWAAVKDHFGKMKEDYIESSVFRKVCSDFGVEKELSQKVLLQFLHDLGLIINFKQIKNFSTQILNPLWLTNGVYRIINSPIVVENNGLMHEDELDSIINDQHFKAGNTQDKPYRYPEDKLTYVVKVMEIFELCWRLDTDTYAVPQLLPVNEPDFKMKGTIMQFVIRFQELLPESIFPRLMVKLNPYIKDGLRWRTGMVLYKPLIFNAYARISADKEEREIHLDLSGDDLHRLLSFVRETIREIASDFTKLEYEELVKVSETGELIDYQYLVEAEKAGEKEIFVKSLKGRVPINRLLDGVEEAEMRSETAQIPVNVFISFAEEDVEYRNELRKALAPVEKLSRLKIWDSQDLTAGAEVEKEIFREIEEADIILCLMSTDYIQPDHRTWKEMEAAMDGYAKGKKIVIPVRLRQCSLNDLPIGKLRSTPLKEWIGSSANKDVVYTEVTKALEPLIERVKEQKLKERGHR